MCFGSASLLGITLAWQRWIAWRMPEKPSFWSAEYLQPAMIPWYAWALIAPILILLLHRVASADMTTPRRVARYAGLALLTIALHTVVASFALGWWWSFPNPIPVDPGWHIMDQVRHRATLSVLVVWVIAATYHATRRASAAPMAAMPGSAGTLPSAAPDPSPIVATGPITLKAADRVWFVDPGDIVWVEADGDYVIVHAVRQQHRSREPISALERRLPADRFVRVSRSAIVNLSAIREVQRWFRGNFVVILRDGTTLRLYVDGTLINSAPGAHTSNDNPLLFGRWTAGEYWNGLIDEVRIYDVARTAAEIERVTGKKPLMDPALNEFARQLGNVWYSMQLKEFPDLIGAALKGDAGASLGTSRCMRCIDTSMCCRSFTRRVSSLVSSSVSLMCSGVG